MIYFKILLLIVAIVFGIFDIYNKKILKKDYKKDNYILLAVVMVYAQTSQSEIIFWLASLVAVIILFIMLDIIKGMIIQRDT